jgi:hypothetical protein
MWARSFVMTAAMTRSAAPLAKSVLATCSIMRPCERSLMPMSTVPFPIGITSPPSSEARPKSAASKRPSGPSSGYQNSKSDSANIGWYL